MMLSKMTLIAFFGALSFRISEIAGVSNTVNCMSDKQFLDEMEERKTECVPVLITTNGHDDADRNIKRQLDGHGQYSTLIRVVVGQGNCPVTDGYFPSQGGYPALFAVRFDHVYDRAFRGSGSESIGEFFRRAAEGTPNSGTGVTETIGRRIEARRNAALSSAARKASTAYGADSDDYAPPGAAWSSTAGRSARGAHDAVGPSGARSGSSSGSDGSTAALANALMRSQDEATSRGPAAPGPAGGGPWWQR